MLLGSIWESTTPLRMDCALADDFLFLKGLERELSHVHMIFVSFQGYFDINESFLLSKNGDFDI